MFSLNFIHTQNDFVPIYISEPLMLYHNPWKFPAKFLWWRYKFPFKFLLVKWRCKKKLRFRVPAVGGPKEPNTYDPETLVSWWRDLLRGRAISSILRNWLSECLVKSLTVLSKVSSARPWYNLTGKKIF